MSEDQNQPGQAPAEGFSDSQFEQLSSSGSRRYHRLEKMIQDISDRQDDTDSKIGDLDAKVSANHQMLTDNTAKTDSTATMVSEVAEVILAARSGLAALGKFGRFMAGIYRFAVRILKAGGSIAAAIAAIYAAIYAFTHGGKP